MARDGNNNGMKTRAIKKSHHVRDRGGMNSREACVYDSRKEGSWLQTQEIDQSGGVAQGCHWSTGAETDERCHHISNGLSGLVAPSKCRGSPIGRLVDPSIMLDGLAIHPQLELTVNAPLNPLSVATSLDSLSEYKPTLYPNSRRYISLSTPPNLNVTPLTSGSYLQGEESNLNEAKNSRTSSRKMGSLIWKRLTHYGPEKLSVLMELKND
ncbi:hypothetical protein Tco_0211175 [Tanacetum coccineum]